MKELLRGRLPAHFRQRVPAGPRWRAVEDALGESRFPTVCEEARCPNRTDCWARGTLSFQILGKICTRRCAFCAETTGRPGGVDADEPRKLAEAVARLGLKHVVITSPARDDLEDQGAGQFAACINQIRATAPGVTIEVLVPDFQGRADLLKMVFQATPDVFNHNLETVPRLSPRVRARATHERSLDVLRQAAAAGLFTKSGLMVGLGETREELIATFRALSGVGVRALTVGQYLPPSSDHFPLDRFYSLEELDDLKNVATPMFQKVMVGPLVRSSYHAENLV